MSQYKILNLLKVVAFLTLPWLGGCTWLQNMLPGQVDQTEGWSAQQFYDTALEARNEGNYETAAKYLEQLQARYPFGRYAQQAQIELIYVYYKNNQSEQAIAAADRFIKANPRHPLVDYAYYMKGVVNFSRGNALLERLLPTDLTETDPKSALQAFSDFSGLVQKFPDSKYAEDAKQRMVFIRNNLAAYEVHVADFYMRKKAYIAAANRAKYVVDTYPQTTAVPDALDIMARAYTQLGLPKLAADARRVLATNYPEDSRAKEEKSKFSLFGYEF